MNQAELLDQLASAINSKHILIHESDEIFFVLLRRMFPVRTSGVRWEELPRVQSRHAQAPRVQLIEKFDAVRDFLIEFGSAAGLGEDDRCVTSGDSLTNVAFELSFRDLLKLFPSFFSLPQSTYVLTPDASWCFAFTFEEDMYFAKSPKM